MKRGLLIVVVAVAVVLALGYGFRLVTHRPGSGVASLLPRDTIALALLPDFNATVDEWHHSDIYQIYREPAVQEFLQKPMSKSSKAGKASGKVHEFQELGAKNAFIALTSIANDKPKFVAGFQFHCSQAVADRVIGDWRSKLNPSANHERTVYEKHEIDLVSQSAFSLATVQDQDWFFAGNDLDEIKALLDRADGRVKDRAALLAGDESFREGMAAMPASYAFMLYFQPKTFGERLAALSKSLGKTNITQNAMLEQIRCVCAATRFDHGKLHDVVFVGMPKQQQKGELTRSSLTLAGPATILYAASLVDFSKQIGLLFPTGQNNPLGPAAQRISDAMAAANLSSADWEKAFGSELGLVSEWSEQTRWPSVVLTAAVRDPVLAKKIIDTLTQGFGADERWEQADRDGIHYWFLAAASGWLSIRPAMAISNGVWIAGLDASSVETAMLRAQKPGKGLGDSDNYRQAAQLVPAPTKVFTYMDPGLIYSRIDATLRPILLMGAAFLPAANDFVDLSKVPPPEAITKHLSPIVSTQYYTRNGYIAESVGPVTMNQAGIGAAVLGGAGAMMYKRLLPASLRGAVAPTTPPVNLAITPQTTPQPSAVPAGTPAPTTKPRPRGRRKY
ncbi:MAG TPA: hypothetical protein VGM62_09695 [Chthoniobacterales bacterium]|jgi:hypothetical protein